MGFGKSFLFSLLAFIGLNFIFTIIYYALPTGPGLDTLFSIIQQFPLMIIYYLFGAILSAPSIILNWTIALPFLFETMTYLILGLGFLIALLISAILAGRFGESKIQSFGGWTLTVILSTTLVINAAWLEPTFQVILFNLYGWTLDIILIVAMINCVINIFFYGFFALLISKVEYY